MVVDGGCVHESRSIRSIIGRIKAWEAYNGALGGILGLYQKVNMSGVLLLDNS